MHPSATASVFRAALNPAPAPPAHDSPTSRAAINRANARHSTGPRTARGKHRSSQNALRHGLTARTAVLPSEDLAAYQKHVQQFLDEYKPGTATEDHLVHELAHTSWRLNRIPLLEADLLTNIASNEKPQAVIVLGSAAQKAAGVQQLTEPRPQGSVLPRHFSARCNTKEPNGIRPRMASFFRKTKSNATRTS